MQYEPTLRKPCGIFIFFMQVWLDLRPSRLSQSVYTVSMKCFLSVPYYSTFRFTSNCYKALVTACWYMLLRPLPLHYPGSHALAL